MIVVKAMDNPYGSLVKHTYLDFINNLISQYRYELSYVEAGEKGLVCPKIVPKAETSYRFYI